jgi:PiT family inorganic phosphate transporter
LKNIFILIGLSITFDILNGLRDGSNFVSTAVSTRVMSTRRALSIAAVAEFLGPFIFGVAVARTFGRDIVATNSITIYEILAALASAVAWNLFTWLASIPSSSTHALLGGILGAVATGAGLQVIRLGGLIKVLVSLFISPPLGLMVGYLVIKMVYRLAAEAPPSINNLFKRLQIPTGIILALSYGANDAQKTMGLISLGLVISGILPSFRVPIWVMALSAGSISIGIFFGGQRLIRTLGGSFYKIRPVHGFSSQLAATSVILGSALLGGPVSSSQVVTSSILGVGAADQLNKIRWEAASRIVESWLLTIPACAGLAAGIYLLLIRVGL